MNLVDPPLVRFQNLENHPFEFQGFTLGGNVFEALANQAGDGVVIFVFRQGNLEEVEKTLLQTILSELRMQFVQAPKEVERKQAEQEAAEELKQTFEDPKSASVETLIDDDEGSDSEE